MNKIRAAIIEDEIPAARLLNKMLTELRPEWEILLLPGNVEGAVKWFNSNPRCFFFFYRTGKSRMYDRIYNGLR